MLGDWELKAAEQPGNVCGVDPIVNKMADMVNEVFEDMNVY
jgi:hypothetical protein